MNQMPKQSNIALQSLSVEDDKNPPSFLLVTRHRVIDSMVSVTGCQNTLMTQHSNRQASVCHSHCAKKAPQDDITIQHPY